MQMATLRSEIGRVRFQKQTVEDCLGNVPSESRNQIKGEEKNLPFFPSILLTAGGDFIRTVGRSGFYHASGYFPL